MSYSPLHLYYIIPFHYILDFIYSTSIYIYPKHIYCY